MLLAQAKVESLGVITADSQFAEVSGEDGAVTTLRFQLARANDMLKHGTMQPAANVLNMLKKRWLRLADSLGVADGQPAWKQLNAGYGSASRHYHNWQHIAQCLYWLGIQAEFANSPIAIEVAIWFHDVIYDSRRHDNEAQSALLAKEVLRGLSIADDVVKLIESTTHRNPVEGNDIALLCDIDLSILGSEATQYDDYASAVRREYDWVSEADFRARRAQVLRGFLARPFIYSLPACHDKWEIIARTNIAREIEQLEN